MRRQSSKSGFFFIQGGYEQEFADQEQNSNGNDSDQCKINRHMFDNHLSGYREQQNLHDRIQIVAAKHLDRKSVV